jgi:hypothetical protein
VRDGVTIDQSWEHASRAFAMTAIPGFPNFFTVMGPNSPVGSIHLQTVAELTADYLIGWLRRFAAGELTTVEVSQDATDRFNAEVRTALASTVWNTGCTSWCLKDDGAVDLWPFDLRTTRRLLGAPDVADYHIQRSATRPSMNR